MQEEIEKGKRLYGKQNDSYKGHTYIIRLNKKDEFEIIIDGNIQRVTFKRKYEAEEYAQQKIDEMEG